MSFELCYETFFPIPIHGMVQAERSTQLTHTQVPLEPFNVIREGETLLAQLPEGNSFTQPINELRRQQGKPVTHVLLCFIRDPQAHDVISPERAGLERAGGGKVSGL